MSQEHRTETGLGGCHQIVVILILSKCPKKIASWRKRREEDSHDFYIVVFLFIVHNQRIKRFTIYNYVHNTFDRSMSLVSYTCARVVLSKSENGWAFFWRARMLLQKKSSCRGTDHIMGMEGAGAGRTSSPFPQSSPDPLSTLRLCKACPLLSKFPWIWTWGKLVCSWILYKTSKKKKLCKVVDPSALIYMSHFLINR